MQKLFRKSISKFLLNIISILLTAKLNGDMILNKSFKYIHWSLCIFYAIAKSTDFFPNSHSYNVQYCNPSDHPPMTTSAYWKIVQYDIACLYFLRHAMSNMPAFKLSGRPGNTSDGKQVHTLVDLIHSKMQLLTWIVCYPITAVVLISYAPYHCTTLSLTLLSTQWT